MDEKRQSNFHFNAHFMRYTTYLVPHSFLFSPWPLDATEDHRGITSLRFVQETEIRQQLPHSTAQQLRSSNWVKYIIFFPFLFSSFFSLKKSKKKSCPLRNSLLPRQSLRKCENGLSHLSPCHVHFIVFKERTKII